ncbi:hypothetical protein Mext_1896 [Methylorubrum extorquens PA1]|nr:hypothetical protein Mext_1896 [Methylorubrum extorquens PA1]
MGGVGCQPASPHGLCRGRQSRWQAEQCPSAGGADLADQIGAMLSRKDETGGDDQLGHSDGTSRIHGRSGGVTLYANQIVEPRDGGSALTPLKGQAHCPKHHSAKTAGARAARMSDRSGG